MTKKFKYRTDSPKIAAYCSYRGLEVDIFRDGDNPRAVLFDIEDEPAAARMINELTNGAVAPALGIMQSFIDMQRRIRQVQQSA